MATLSIQDGRYLVDDLELQTGMIVRRYDEIGALWFEGQVCQLSGYNHNAGQWITAPALFVEGYAPSPFRNGDTVEIISR